MASKSFWWLAIAAIALGWGGQAAAAILVLYDFQAPDTGGVRQFDSNPQSIADHLTGSQWTSALGTPVGQLRNVLLRDFAISADGWDNVAQEFRFSLEVEPQYQIKLTEIHFQEDPAPRPLLDDFPTTWQLLMDNAVIASAPADNPFDEEFAAVDLTKSGTIQFVLRALGTTSPNVNWRIDNFRLIGDVIAPAPVPLPPSLWLFLSATLIGLVRRTPV